MKLFSLAVLSVGFLGFSGMTAQAGFDFPIDLAQTVCVQDYSQVNVEMDTALKEACENSPGARGAHATVNMTEFHRVDEANCNAFAFQYHLIATCYIP